MVLAVCVKDRCPQALISDRNTDHQTGARPESERVSFRRIEKPHPFLAAHSADHAPVVI